MAAHFPLPLRNALAETVIAGLDASDARVALGWLATCAGPPPAEALPRLTRGHLVDGGALLDVHRPHAGAIMDHAARGLRAAARHQTIPVASGESAAARALRQAAALWSAGLFFEVHEVLEIVWARSEGHERTALQGVIQIGVAFHHLTHGNPRGAKTLMRDGRERLGATGAALPTLDAGALVAATAPWEVGLDAGHPPDTEPPPLILRGSPTPADAV